MNLIKKKRLYASALALTIAFAACKADPPADPADRCATPQSTGEDTGDCPPEEMHNKNDEEPALCDSEAWLAAVGDDCRPLTVPCLDDLKCAETVCAMEGGDLCDQLPPGSGNALLDALVACACPENDAPSCGDHVCAAELGETKKTCPTDCVDLCDTHSDCAVGECVPDFFDQPNECLVPCEDDSGCSDGTQCVAGFDSGVCRPYQNHGNICTHESQCGGGDQCIATGEGIGACTTLCDPTGDIVCNQYEVCLSGPGNPTVDMCAQGVPVYVGSTANEYICGLGNRACHHDAPGATATSECYRVLGNTPAGICIAPCGDDGGGSTCGSGYTCAQPAPEDTILYVVQDEATPVACTPATTATDCDAAFVTCDDFGRGLECARPSAVCEPN